MVRAAARPAAASATPVDVLIRLLKLGTLINAPMKALVCEPSGYSQSELKVLMALAGEGELAGHQLARITGLPAMAISRAIAVLAAAGLVTASDAATRRRKPVCLTAAGQDFYARLQPAMATVAERLLGGLGARERGGFAATADAIIAEMTRWNGGDGES